MMGGVLLGAMLVVSPAVTSTSDVDQWGPLRFERSSALTWPGLRAPSFSLINERRWVHSFTLGFTPPALQGLEFSVVSLEPNPTAPTLRNAMFDPSSQGSVWVGVGYRFPGPSATTLSLGQSFTIGPSVLPTARGLSEGQSFVLLPRLLFSRRI